MADYDNKTLREMFGRPICPKIPISLQEVSHQAQRLAGKLSISGVQPKLSVRLEGDSLITVERDGQYILKPQTQEFPQLPENEYLCMQMGKLFGLSTANCVLLKLSDGSKAYVVKRFDRRKKGRKLEKLPCEDMQQIIGGRDKYDGSHEQIAKAIKQYCTFAPLELQRFFELTIFNFAIGNGDAHKKNFSLLTTDGNVAFSPAYDLVSSRLVIPEEKEDLALTLNGKHTKFLRRDFRTFADNLGIAENYADKKINQLLGLQGEFTQMIKASALNTDMKERFLHILQIRFMALR